MKRGVSDAGAATSPGPSKVQKTAMDRGGGSDVSVHPSSGFTIVGGVQGANLPKVVHQKQGITWLETPPKREVSSMWARWPQKGPSELRGRVAFTVVGMYYAGIVRRYCGRRNDPTLAAAVALPIRKL